jgi:peptidyl-prolyl cis-trans isomerase SurA
MIRKLCVFILGISFALSCFAKAQLLDEIVAKANDQIITYQQLLERSKQFAIQLKAENIKLPARKLFLNQVLQTMVNEQLQLQLAQRSGIDVTDYDVQQALQLVAKQQKISTQQLIKNISSEGISYHTYLQTLRDQLIIQKLQQQAVVSQVRITPEEVQSYMRTADNSGQGVNLYHVEDILVTVSDAPTPAEIQAAKQKAQDIMMQAVAGASFKTLAVADSNGQEALQGGDLGWRSLAELPSVFAKRLVNLKTGDLDGPIRAPNGFHIIHLIGVKRNPQAPNTNALQNHISEMLFRQKIEERLQQWIEQLRGQSYVKLYM